MTGGDRAGWRFLGIRTYDGATNMAVDEAMLLARSQNIVPNTIRLYQWKPPAVSIGYFLKMNEVADVEACRKLGIDVVRRISGGGAVYHSESEVTYTVIVKQDDPVVPKDLIQIYRKLGSAVMIVPMKLGLETYFEPGHEGVCPYTVVSGRKISGNAQARKRGVILQHGTLLLDCDLKVMSKVLKLPRDLVEARVTTLKRELDEKYTGKSEVVKDVDSVQVLLREGFKESLGIKLEDGSLTDFEINETQKLKTKYVSKEWTYMH
nr:biotin/lipoate A/B protein ligase family protein [Candidatus Njordarchaeum guaymaensis]